MLRIGRAAVDETQDGLGHPDNLGEEDYDVQMRQTNK